MKVMEHHFHVVVLIVLHVTCNVLGMKPRCVTFSCSYSAISYMVLSMDFFPYGNVEIVLALLTSF